MKAASLTFLLALLLSACGGAPKTSAAPPGFAASIALRVTAGAAPTSAPLPNNANYGGQILLPAGSGTAMMSLSSTPPGIPTLTELTPDPPIAYITLTAQTPFTLSSLPGLNLTVTPQSLAAIQFFLNQYNGTQWTIQKWSWTNYATSPSTVCFARGGSPVSLQTGQSLYLGISGDNVIPTASPGPNGPPPCPQSS